MSRSGLLALWLPVFVVVGVCAQTQVSEPKPKASTGIPVERDLEVAMSMKKAGRLLEAESILRSHLKAHKEAFSYLTELGLVLVQQGRREEAIEEYRKAIRAFPKHKGIAGVYCDLGLALEFDKEEDKALEAYQKAIELDPTLVSARVDLGNFYRFVKRDYGKATQQLKKAIEIAPKDSIAHAGLAAIYADQGELKQAEAAFREALKIAPDTVSIRTELAYVLEREGAHSEAEKMFEAVIDKFPTFYRAHEGLARVLQALKHLNRAESQAKTAVRLRSDEGTLEVLASIYQQEGKTAHAKRFWLAVLGKNPQDVQALRHLGLLGKTEKPPPAPPPPKVASSAASSSPPPPPPAPPTPPAAPSSPDKKVAPLVVHSSVQDMVGPVKGEGWSTADYLIFIPLIGIVLCACAGGAVLCYQMQTQSETKGKTKKRGNAQQRSEVDDFEEVGLLDAVRDHNEP